MKKILLTIGILIILVTVGFVFIEKDVDEIKTPVTVTYNFTKDFKDYWLTGKAELSSYELSKARYGELHKGEAVFIFVVEPFLPNEQVKSDGLPSEEKSERVMKLINSQNFYTGIYPYSIMTSSFYPLNINRNGVLKISMSSQDWCGQVYSQLNRSDNTLHLQKFSYFQKEGDIKSSFENGILEEELFSIIRINPDNLPMNEFSIYPSSEYFRLTHKEIKKYLAKAFLTKNETTNETVFKLTYTDLERELTIKYENNFPHKILEWEETYSDFSGKKLTSTAKLKRSINLDYWKFHSVEDSTYRKMLALN